MSVSIRSFLAVGVLFILYAVPAHGLPSYREVRRSYAKSDSMLVDRHGEPLYELRTDRHGRRLDWTALADISPALMNAVIQAEDKRFYTHAGVDYTSLGMALLKGMTAEELRGASTITMQLASILDRDLRPKKGKRTVWQKAKQIVEAREMEKRWSKQEILEAYLNLITFRGELQGIAAAARGLFGKAPQGLDQAEALVLASLIRSPNAACAEVSARALLLAQALDWSVQEAEINAKVSRILWGPTLRSRADLAPHVARLLVTCVPQGRTIACTLDSRIQRFAAERLRHHLIVLRSQNVTDGAVLVMENETGEVLAYVSYSGDPAHGWFVDGVQAKRQAGSTLKPFLYALAFDRKVLTPASVLEDSPLDISVFAGIYRPQDYEAEFKGLVTARTALASSINVPAVKTLSMIGLEPFLAKLRRLGIKGLNESGDFYGPSLALGCVDVSLWELTNAYRSLANEGTWGEPRLTLGRVTSSRATRVFSRDATFLISDILSDREARSATFGLENPLATRFWTAVKTGTSKDMRDNWCIGYSRRYTVGVWVGNFSGEPMWNVSGISGAAPVWIEVMNRLHEGGDNREQIPPASLVKRKIRFPQGVAPPREEWFIEGTEPNTGNQKVGQLNQRIIYPPSGTIIAIDPDIPPELQRVFFISQPKGDHLRWVLNDQTVMEDDANLPWTPKVGVYTLTLVDQEGRALDAVQFQVRGPAEK
jgi:penicillin-binding protein 1C